MSMRIFLLIVTVFLAGIFVTELFFKKDQEIHGGIQPTASDILRENIDADIFQYNGLIYINIETVDIDMENYQKGLPIGNIIKQSTDSNEFKNGTATKLPIGTKIYQTIGKGQSILTIEIKEETLIYIAMLDETLLYN